jgi:hypothetical protein
MADTAKQISPTINYLNTYQMPQPYFRPGIDADNYRLSPPFPVEKLQAGADYWVRVKAWEHDTQNYAADLQVTVASIGEPKPRRWLKPAIVPVTFKTVPADKGNPKIETHDVMLDGTVIEPRRRWWPPFRRARRGYLLEPAGVELRTVA